MSKEIKFIAKLKQKVLNKRDISFSEAQRLIHTPTPAVPYLLAAANEIKLKCSGRKVVLCGIVNARSGKCSENCSFCAQSAHYQTKTAVYPLKTRSELVQAAIAAKKAGSNCFSIVTSGKGVNVERDLLTISAAIKDIKKKVGINKCSSLGALTAEQAKKLRSAGLDKYHHNLETAESFFKNICTTHDFQDRVATIRNAKQAGLKVCSGGIIGLGESAEQRVELAFALKTLGVESIPINVLNPIPGTPAARNKKRITPLEILKTIAVFRFVLPDKIIGVFGGREVNLRDLQGMIFWAGANSFLIGDYLTTTGRPAAQDLQLIKDLELITSR